MEQQKSARKKSKVVKKQRGNNVGKGNAGKYKYLKGQGFNTNPERINKKGRPPKLIHHIVEELKEKGYQPVTETQIIDAYQMLLQLPKAGVSEIERDEKKPYFLRLVAKWMSSKKGMEMLDRIMDRSFGRVMQRQQIDSTVTLAPEPGEKTIDQAALLKEVQARLDDEDKK